MVARQDISMAATRDACGAARPAANDRYAASLRRDLRVAEGPAPGSWRYAQAPHRLVDDDRPHRAEPRKDGREGGQARLHVLEPVRLRHRRGDRQPGAAGRTARRAVPEMAADPQ